MSRHSKQKETILRVIMNTGCHPQADWVYEQVRREIPNISLGTVYRNLKLLAESGEIQQLDIAGGNCRFDGNLQNHCHFRCKQCGQVIDIDEPAHSEMDRKVAWKTGLMILGHRLEFHGICTDCQQQLTSRKIVKKKSGERE